MDATVKPGHDEVSMKPKVYVYIPADASGASHKRLEAAGCELSFGDASWRAKRGATVETFHKNANNPQALLGARMEGLDMDRKLLSGFSDLRIIGRYNIGYDDVDLEDCTDMGIIVTHAPVESNWGGVAEGAFAMMLSMLKRLPALDRRVREGGWRSPDLNGTFVGRRQDGYGGITVGIVGLGRVGSRFADLIAPWRVRLLAHDPYVDESKFVHHNATPVDLDTLLRESDVVTLHCNYTKAQHHMIGAEKLKLMKKTAVLINTARGPLVDGDALYDALSADRLGGAALDVFEIEPVPKQTPLLSLGDKLLCAPHMVGGAGGGQQGQNIDWATNAVLAALRGEVPRHVVNEDVIPKWRARFGGKSLL
jgi:D-3-phosphoglycerate dehydrogenase / 2-oxoglutarate reductase